MPEAHNILMVDQWQYETVPCQLRSYDGATSMSEPNWWAQFVDGDAASIFSTRPNPVDIYRRQLAILTLPGGSPLLFDVFRVNGGKRHDMLWYVPADRPVNMPGEGQAIKAEHSGEYQGLKNYNYDVLTGKSVRFYGRGSRMITDLKRY
jgi:hypothetical protein